MMKLKSILIAMCSMVCAGAVYTAVNSANDVEYVSASEASVDMSATTTISAWSTSAELKLLTISFGCDALSDFNYDAMDTETFKYIQDYLYFNGKSVAEINADTSLGAVNWEYTQFPGNANDKYKVPVLIYERDAQRLRLFIHENYFNSLGDAPTFEVKEGLSFDTNGKTYVMDETKRFAYNGEGWEETEAAPEETLPEVDAVDVTDNVTIEGWKSTGNAGELTYTRIFFGEGVFHEGFNYDMHEEVNKNLLNYITINGRSVADINANTDVSNYTFSTFPSSASAKYQVPVVVYVNGSKVEVKVHNNYIATLGAGNIEIGVKAGFTFTNATTGISYKTTRDVSVVVKEGVDEQDITSNVTIEGWDKTGSARELTYTRINFGAGVLPSDLGYHVLDSDIGTQYHYIKDYITINGKTVGQINAETDVSSYVFSSFPSTAADKYKVPVILFGNGDNLEVKVHNDYIASLGANTAIVIGVKSGLYFEGSSVRYTVKSDVTATVSGVSYTDITSNVNIHGWDKTGDAKELTYAQVSFGEGILPAGLNYDIMDKASYQYLQEYITINGKTVKEINETTDVSGYTFSTFPSTVGGVFAVPVVIFANGDTNSLEVKVHNDYIATLGDVNIVIGVKSGAYVEGASTIYQVMQDVEVAVREKAIVVDVTENVSINRWQQIGDMSELTRTLVFLGEGVFPEGVSYKVMDDAAYKYVQDYITINGKTVKEINTTTDASGYAFHTFPSTAADIYKVPVIIYINGDELEVRVHNDYLASLGGNIEVVIGVKAGLNIVNGATTYTVSQDVETCVRKKNYVLTVEIGKGVNEEYLAAGSEISLEEPSVYGYIFNGWLDKETNAPMASVMPEGNYTVYASLTAIEYKVIFMDGETVVDEVSYTLDDTAIVEPSVPEKDGYTGAWESYALTGGEIVVYAVYTEIPVTPPTSEEEPPVSEEPEVPPTSEEEPPVSEEPDVPATSEKPSTSEPAEESASKKGGCGSMIGGLSVGAIGLLAAVLLKKKENE